MAAAGRAHCQPAWRQSAQKGISMFSDAFYEWWFAPWKYARPGAQSLPLHANELARRDGYQAWCQLNEVASDLSADCDREWEIARTADGDELLATARLFGGLFAARENDTQLLVALPFADRKWCMSVAALQPLSWLHDVSASHAESIEMHGLRELAVHLEHGFPGLWSRLRLLLPAELADKLVGHAPGKWRRGKAAGSAAPRLQRCWRMCRDRATSLA